LEGLTVEDASRSDNVKMFNTGNLGAESGVATIGVNTKGRYIKVWKSTEDDYISFAEFEAFSYFDPRVDDNDGDGIPDSEDDYPQDNTRFYVDDFDNDGIRDHLDDDDDNDGVPDVIDAMPFDPNESVDTDGDGIGNNADPDDDNDGFDDSVDCAPLDPLVSCSDVDGDGIDDAIDWDDDGDGIEDALDPEPLNASVQYPKSLLAWWRFDEQKGERVFDSVHNLSAKFGMGGRYGTSPFGESAKIVKEGITFDSEVVAEITDEFTFSFWIKGWRDNNWSTILMARDSEGERVVDIYYALTPHLVFGSGSPYESIRLDIADRLEKETWHHIVATKSVLSGEMALYVDGEQIVKGYDKWAPLNSIASFTIGEKFVGDIDNLRIYNSVLSPEEVKALSNERRYVLAPSSEWIITKENQSAVSNIGEPLISVSDAPRFVANDIPRRFALELNIPQIGFENLTVQYDPSVMELQDSLELITEKYPSGGKRPPSPVRRYYFISKAPTDETEIRFLQSDGSGLKVPLTIWSGEDLQKKKYVNNMLLPVRFPAGENYQHLRKTRQVEHSPINGSQAKVLLSLGAASRMDPVDITVYDLQDVWDMVPQASAYGRDVEGGPDPICGKQVESILDSFYPYVQVAPVPGNAGPLQVKSPLDEDCNVIQDKADYREVVSNQPANGDYSSGAYIDDGFYGMQVGSSTQIHLGHAADWRYYFSQKLVANATDNFIRTGDKDYLDQAVVMLVRLATEVSYTSAMPQGRRAHYWAGKKLNLLDATEEHQTMGNAGPLRDGIRSSGLYADLASYYDKLFPHIDSRFSILAPLFAEQGLEFKDADSLRAHIDFGLFLPFYQMMLSGQAGANFPANERGFARAAYYMDYPATDMVDVLTKGMKDTRWPQGILNDVVYSCFWRDGVKCESPGGYNAGAIEQSIEIFDLVKDITDLRPGIYDPDTYPVSAFPKRFLSAGLSMIKHAALPTIKYYLGDAGVFPSYDDAADTKTPKYNGDAGLSLFRRLYSEFGDQRIAWVLEHSGDHNYQGLSPDIKDDWRDHPTLLNGIGIGILRTGRGSASTSNKGERSIYSHYGSVGGHMGDTQMGLHLFAHGQQVFNQWGYPSNWDNWYTSHWTQNAGRQYTDGELSFNSRKIGYNDLIASAGSVQLMDNTLTYYDYFNFNPNSDSGGVSVTNYSEPEQKRMTLLINTAANNQSGFYVLDWYRMFGGDQHMRPFNTLDGTLETTGLDLTSASGLVDKKYPNFEQVLTGSQTDMDTPWSAIWKVAKSDQTPTDLRVRMHGISGADKVQIARAVKPLRDSSVRNYIVIDTDVSETKASQSLTAIEVFKESVTGSFIENITSLSVTDTDIEATYPAQGIEVKLKSGRRDYLILSNSRSSTKTMQVNGVELTLAGQVAFLSLDSDGRVLELSGFNADSVDFGTYSATNLSSIDGQWTGTIEDVNHDDWIITLDRSYDDPLSLVGRHVTVKKGDRQLSLEVESSENLNGHLTLTVQSAPTIYKMQTVGYKSRWLLKQLEESSTSSLINTSKAYHGSVVVGASGAQYEVDSITSAGLRFAEDYDVKELERDFPIGEIINVYDYDRGFDLIIPSVVKAKTE
jgi:hypothetical protein